MTPSAEIPNAIHDLVADVVAAFLRLEMPLREFRSYALGAWQVFQGEYSECARYRADYVRLADAAILSKVKEVRG